MSTYHIPTRKPSSTSNTNAVRRDEVVGILLALFLGSFGLHHFYLRRTGLGILYCCFFWTGIPGLLGFLECFFMPGRVREFNAIQAAAIAASLGIAVPGWGQPVNVTMNVPGNMPPAPMPAPGAATFPPPVMPHGVPALPAHQRGGRAVLLRVRTGVVKTGNRGTKGRERGSWLYRFQSHRIAKPLHSSGFFLKKEPPCTTPELATPTLEPVQHCSQHCAVRPGRSLTFQTGHIPDTFSFSGRFLFLSWGRG